RSTATSRLRKSIGLKGVCITLSNAILPDEIGFVPIKEWDPTIGKGSIGVDAAQQCRGRRTHDESLASAQCWHCLHGDDRQPAIWLDAVRPSHPGEGGLEARGDPGGLHPLRSGRD